jgi:regulator of nonsense transcripts 2
MPEAVNREMIDKLAVEFGFLNSKAARKRLIKVGKRDDKG